MGYVGSFSYSPMEPGLVEMNLKAKTVDTTSQEQPVKELPPGESSKPEENLP
jgi:hypothetical protein